MAKNKIRHYYSYLKPQCLSELLLALLDAVVTTNNAESKNELCQSLQHFGFEKPGLFLQTAHAFLLQHPKLPPADRATILTSINIVLCKSNTLAELDEQQGLLIINLVTQEITLSKDSEQEWAECAKEILVTLGKNDRFVHHVMEALLQKFPPGHSHSPPKYIVLSLSAVSEHNPSGFIPFLTDILSRAVRLLSQLKTDSMKSVWSQALCSFCDCIVEYSHSAQANEKDTSYNDIIKDYYDQMENLYDIILPWVHSKDSRVKADSVECIGTLCTMIEKKRVIKDVKKLVTMLTTLYKRSSIEEQLAMTRGICHFLEASCEESEELVPLDHYIDDILNNIFPHVCIDHELKDVVFDEKTKSSPNMISIKLRNESLRCFHVAADRFADKIVYYLLHKMQSVLDNVKLGAINLMRHLLNSASVQMEDKRALIIMGLKPMLTPDGLSAVVRKGISQLCIALADHGFLDKMSGGSLVIDFLTRNLITDSMILSRNGLCYDSESSLSTVHSHCAQALHTIAKNCDSSLDLLWPHLFEFVCSEQYNAVSADIFKCIRIVANRMIEKNGKLNFEEGFDCSKIAGSIQVFARLIVSLNASPLSAAVIYRIKEALLLMKCLGEWFHENLVKVFDQKLDELIAAAEDLLILSSSSYEHTIVSPQPSNRMSRSFSNGCKAEIKITRLEKWNLVVMDFVKESVLAINSGDWRQSLASSMAKQMTLYGSQSRDRSFLLRCIGSILSYITDNNFVVEHLLLVFRSANHSNHIERIGVSMAVGYCSQSHTDLVLTELENIAKWEHLKKNSSGFFGFMSYKTYTDLEMINLRATLMLSYGYLMINCPTETIVQRLEKTVLVFLRIYMGNTKQEIVVKEALLETMHLIATSLHPSNFSSDYKFDMRKELYGYIKEYIQAENAETLSSWIRLLGCNATIFLIKLEPNILENELWDLVKVMAKFILPICREKSGLKTIDDDQASTMMEATVSKFKDVIKQMIKKKPIVETVFDFLKILFPYYGSPADHERKRVIEITVLILETYKNYATDVCLGKAVDFMPMSYLLARLTPRLADSLFQVRQLALTAIRTTFSLWYIHRGFAKDETNLFDSQQFTETYLNGDSKLDSNTARKCIDAMGEQIENKLPKSQIQQYLSVLFDMLTDRQSNVSCSAAQLITIIIKNRGGSLHSEAEFLTVVMLEKLPLIHICFPTYCDLLNALITLASHQLYTVVDILLRQELPFSESQCDVWKSLARESTQFGYILDYLLEIMGLNVEENQKYISANNTSVSVATFLPFELKDIGSSATKYVTPEVCSFLSAMQLLVSAAPSDDCLSQRAYQILAISFQLLAAIVDAKFPLLTIKTEDSAENDEYKGKISPVILTKELRKTCTTPAYLISVLIKQLLQETKNDSIIERMNHERSWTNLVSPLSYTSAIDVICKALCDERPSWLRPLARQLEQYIGSSSEAHRISIAVVFSSLVSRCPDQSGNFDLEFFDDLIKALLECVKDDCLLVKKLSIKGLGQIPIVASICHEESSNVVLEKYIKLAVQASMEGLNDANDFKDEVTIESLRALDSLILVSDKSIFDNIIAVLLVQLKIRFEKDNAVLRAISFSLLAEIGQKFGYDDTFIDALHSNIVSVILHLNDEDELVRKKCVMVLKKTSCLFTAPAMTNLIESTFKYDEVPKNYTTFIKDFAMVLALSYPDRLNNNALVCAGYFNSTSPRIRMNSIIFIGYLLAELSASLRTLIPTDIIFHGLAEKLKDPNTDVVLAAGKAISCLTNFS
uniref:DUF2428 domain-containing protein n=1 Tax=Rhabditophanes sp. KR3021 TaxID=114890 RepID=A0AC35UAG3_9BILA